jgi:hypothetical protein
VPESSVARQDHGATAGSLCRRAPGGAYDSLRDESGDWNRARRCPCRSRRIAARACGESSKSSTVEKVRAFASAVNLRHADVPQFTSARKFPRQETRVGPVGRCDGGVLEKGHVIAIYSQDFGHDNERKEGETASISFLPIEGVSSAVYVSESAMKASGELSALESAATRACVKREDYTRATTQRERSASMEPVWTDVAVSPMPAPLQGVPSYATRVTARFFIEAPGSRGRSRYYEDALGFVAGRALISLHATGDPYPVPRSLEHRLLLLLYSRAKAHKL